MLTIIFYYIGAATANRSDTALSDLPDRQDTQVKALQHLQPLRGAVRPSLSVRQQLSRLQKPQVLPSLDHPLHSIPSGPIARDGQAHL